MTSACEALTFGFSAFAKEKELNVSIMLASQIKIEELFRISFVPVNKYNKVIYYVPSAKVRAG